MFVQLLLKPTHTISKRKLSYNYALCTTRLKEKHSGDVERKNVYGEKNNHSSRG